MKATKKSDKNATKTTKIAYPKANVTVLEQATKEVTNSLQGTIDSSYSQTNLYQENERLKQQIDEIKTNQLSSQTASSSSNASVDLSPLESAISQNASDIDSLQTNVSTNANNISTLQQNVTTNAISIANNSNAITNLQNSKQDKLTAGNNISISNGVISATDTTYTAGQNITIENGVISSTASGGMTAEQSQQLSTLYNYYLSQQTDPDPYYNPRTFSDFPAGTILQGYAKFEKKYNKSFYGTITTTKMVFSAENQSAGTLHLTINFTASATFNGLVKVYNNNTEIFSETVSFSDASLNFEYQKEIMGLALSDGNVFYVSIGANPTNTSLVLKFAKAELIAPNAEVINQVSPYSVEYFNSKYYISDCSTGTAKVAEIGVNDIININSLSWTDTGIHCSTYKTAFFIEQYGNMYQPTNKMHAYISLDDRIVFESDDRTQSSYQSEYNYVNWLQTTANYMYFTTIKNDTDKDTVFNVYSAYNLSLNYYNNSYFAIDSAQYSSNYNWLSSSNTRRYATQIASNGDIYASVKHINNIAPQKIAKGCNTHTYYKTTSSSYCSFLTYFKHYDKILCVEWKYSSGRYTIVSTTEIGAYEEYWDGANNDYFVLKNGQLEYHKKPTV